jgi:peptidoglycan hydrolase-like amidase
MKTRGVFLVSDGTICDARYHKACGGMTENYGTCWEARSVPYLSHVTDAARPLTPLRSEEDAERWILSHPDVCCGTGDQDLLRRILPDFDRETADFFRWQVRYERAELESLLREKAGIDFGTLQVLTPLERGPSGRISRLKIEGTKRVCIVGKELEIRRWLSPSHLYSSAFIVSTERAATGLPLRFTLYGAGWGHGVGLCQIGAAVMAEQGFNAEEILHRYFLGAALVKRY